MIKTNKVKELIGICHTNSVKAGWWENYNNEETLATKICLIHSEIDEAYLGLRDNLKDDKLPHRSMEEVEMADTAIRIMDYLGFRKMINGELRLTDLMPMPRVECMAYMTEIHYLVTTAMEGMRKGNPVKESSYMWRSLSVVVNYCNMRGMDLWGAVHEKIAFNSTREDHKIENREKDGGKKV